MALWCCGADGISSVTSKNAAQLRSLEAMGLSRGHGPRLRRTEVQVPVTLNVYSLVESNKKLSKMGMGVFHTGVIVYGIEWGYGEVVDNPNTSGLFCVHPGEAAGTLYRTIRIGHTTRSPMQVDTILHRLENEWRSSDYHILHHNCNHFAQAFCDLLSTTEKLRVPSWCNRAARVGDRIIPRRLATKVQRMMGDEPPKASVPEARALNINEVPASVVPHEWYLHPSISQPLRYIDESKPPSMGTQDGHSTSASVGVVNGGSAHYSARCSIVQPKVYEITDTRSLRSSITGRETYCSTDEKGGIMHMMAIEETPTVTPSSWRASAGKSAASQHATKPTSVQSPAPPSPGITFSSGAQDRVVLQRVRASPSPSHSVAPTGSPQVSAMEVAVKNVPLSEISDEPSPPVVPRLPLTCSLSSGTANSRTATPTGSTTSRHREESLEQQQYVENNSRKEDAKASSEKLLCRMRNSYESLSVELSAHANFSAQPPSSLRATSSAMPVGCISTLLPTLPNPPAEEVTQRSSDRMAAEHDVSTDISNISSEVNNTSGDLASAKHQHRPQSATTTSVHKAQKPSRDPGNEFSNVTAVPACGTPSSSTTVAASPAGIKHKNSSAWKFLKNQCGFLSKAGNGKAVSKYLSTPSSSGNIPSVRSRGPHVEAVSMSSARSAPSSPSSLEPETSDERKEAPVAADGDSINPTAEAARAWRREEGDHTQVLLSAASVPPPSPHAVSNEMQAVNGTTPMPTTAVLQNAPRLPQRGSDLSASTTDLLPWSPERRLSRSATPSMQGGILSPGSPLDLGEATVASQLMDSPGPQLPPYFVTPERPNIITSSEAVTMVCSPATAHQQRRRASSSAAMSDTPPPKREQLRTSIPFAVRPHGNDENDAPALQLDLGSDEAEEAGMPSTTDETANVPTVPCLWDPSSLHCEETTTGGGRMGEHASSDYSQGSPAAQHSHNTQLTDPARLSPTPSQGISAPEANPLPTLSPYGTY
ncbi:hypothetical protein, conserved [Leishmania tarentolae]|uniref:PPPDE domain-containing protein n=1 Tax=Leishmania tarentolae TaxID=5689 RepID=A0A640KIM7_LEITA|nr:hypothetical protein, conserved [Leishmania tarentolae]